ncbi:hypothetical protein QE152_g25825 [Popillia japonica]|uniref:Uncharacterized protein n=1 Tax=Popillia japonica TaxID=7064 RepID=A0AAW1JYV8_POPJA
MQPALQFRKDILHSLAAACSLLTCENRYVPDACAIETSLSFQRYFVLAVELRSSDGPILFFRFGEDFSPFKMYVNRENGTTVGSVSNGYETEVTHARLYECIRITLVLIENCRQMFSFVDDRRKKTNKYGNLILDAIK